MIDLPGGVEGSSGWCGVTDLPGGVEGSAGWGLLLRICGGFTFLTSK